MKTYTEDQIKKAATQWVVLASLEKPNDLDYTKISNDELIAEAKECGEYIIELMEKHN